MTLYPESYDILLHESDYDEDNLKYFDSYNLHYKVLKAFENEHTVHLRVERKIDGIYDMCGSKCKIECESVIMFTFDKRIFEIAIDRNQRYKEAEEIKIKDASIIQNNIVTYKPKSSKDPIVTKEGLEHHLYLVDDDFIGHTIMVEFNSKE